MPFKNSLRYVGLVTEVGLIVVISIGGGLLLGLWLDRKLGTRALFTILLILVGLASAVWKVYRMALPRKKQ